MAKLIEIVLYVSRRVCQVFRMALQFFDLLRKACERHNRVFQLIRRLWGAVSAFCFTRIFRKQNQCFFASDAASGPMREVVPVNTMHFDRIRCLEQPLLEVRFPQLACCFTKLREDLRVLKP
ncbi:hypothetical protein C7I84_23465 [Mesorhizobium ephedrae]|uniref:Uncharacterized protein n=1 Tax=Kumtagia ephedrae TaxID=2116701 RepID=A0A2P7RXM2_9HYPH|nr:hypothetical protein C7I84_23465 [Mesorhizobium ephedrae]